MVRQGLHIVGVDLVALSEHRQLIARHREERYPVEERRADAHQLDRHRQDQLAATGRRRDALEHFRPAQ